MAMGRMRLDDDWGGPRSDGSTSPGGASKESIQKRDVWQAKAAAPRPASQRPAPVKQPAPAPKASAPRAAAVVSPIAVLPSDPKMMMDTLRNGQKWLGDRGKDVMNWLAKPETQRAMILGTSGNDPAVVQQLESMEKLHTDTQKQKEETKKNEEAEQRRRAAAGDALSMDLTKSTKTAPDDWLNLMDAQDKSALNYNLLYTTAVERDKALVKELDKNKDGRVTLSEAGDRINQGNYRAATSRVVGREADKDTVFAPHTLGLLNTLDVRDNTLTLEDYATGRGAISDVEMRAGLHRNQKHYPGSMDDTRSKVVSNIANKTNELEALLRQGVSVNGPTSRLDITGDREQASRIAGSMAQGLQRDFGSTDFLRTKAPTINNAPGTDRYDRGGVDFANVLDPDATRRRSEIEQWADVALKQGVTPEDLIDERKVRALGLGKGPTAHLDPTEFVTYLKSKYDPELNKAEKSEWSDVGTTLEGGIMDEIGRTINARKTGG